MTQQLPEGWTTKDLSELLDAEQQKSVQKIVAEILAGTAETKSLKVYLRTQEESLVAKGVLPEYLYYCLVYQLDLPL